MIELQLNLSNTLQLNVELMIDVSKPFFQGFYRCVAVQRSGETSRSLFPCSARFPASSPPSWWALFARFATRSPCACGPLGSSSTCAIRHAVDST